MSGSINQGSQLYWIDDADDVTNGTWETYKTLERKYRDQVQNEVAIFVKDDWKVTPVAHPQPGPPLGILRGALYWIGLYNGGARDRP